jgi:putative membrane protein
MTVLTLLRSELKRLTATKLGVLAFIALMAVPLLYGGIYLWGNLDPYSNLKHVPAAVVVADTGTTTDGEHVNRGRDAADDLVDAGAFDWQRLSPEAAKRQLETGGVDFVVTFPASFSKDLASAGSTDPQQAAVRLTTSDANSYLSSTIAGQVATKIRDAVAQEVGTAAAKSFLVGLSDVRGDLADASDGAAKLESGAADAKQGADSLASGTASLASGASSLTSGARSAASGAATLASGARSTASGADRVADGLGTLASRTDALPDAADRLSSGADRVADGNAALASALSSASTSTETAAALQRTLAADGLSPAQIQQALAVLAPSRTALQQAASSARTLASGSRSVATGASSLSSATERVSSSVSAAATGARRVASGTQQVSSGARSLASGARTLASGAATLSTGAATAARGSATLDSGLGTIASGTASLHDGLAKGVTAIPATTAAQRTAEAEAIGNPAHVATTKATSAGTYGAGLAPLFLSLSAWIGAYALFLILRPLSRRALTAIRQPIRVALAGWLTPALLGVAQMVALFLIAVGPLGIEVVHPLGTIGVLALTAAAFAAILLLLNAALGSVGQFLGLILMLVQLVTAGGTFPWQTLPGPLAAVHHALPMAYSVEALRQVMYGGDLALAWGDVAVLATWLVAAVALTAAIAARMTRHRTLRDLQPSLIGG